MVAKKLDTRPIATRETYLDPEGVEVQAGVLDASTNTKVVEVPAEATKLTVDTGKLAASVGEEFTPQTPEEKLHLELEQWWLDQAHTEVAQVIPKAIEYGGASRDHNLIAMGQSIVNAGFPLPVGLSEQSKSEFLAELAIYVYIQGKLARWGAALNSGRFVSDDTGYDIGIYTRMVQRIRDAGGWLK